MLFSFLKLYFNEFAIFVICDILVFLIKQGIRMFLTHALDGIDTSKRQENKYIFLNTSFAAVY